MHHRAGQLDCVPQRVLLCVVFIKLCAIVILKEWDQDRDCVQSSQLCHCVHSASEWSVRVRFSWSTPPSSPCLYCPVFLPHQTPPDSQTTFKHHSNFPFLISLMGSHGIKFGLLLFHSIINLQPFSLMAYLPSSLFILFLFLSIDLVVHTFLSAPRPASIFVFLL